MKNCIINIHIFDSVVTNIVTSNITYTVIAIIDLLGSPLAAPALDSPTVHDARKMVVNAARPTLRPPPPHGGAPLRHTRPLLLLSLADRCRARAVATACPQATDQAINTNQHSSCS